MHRATLLSALALSMIALAAIAIPLAAPPAAAMEMFTNFDNGTNAAGFPPMMTPVAIYGPGGWNTAAMGCVAVPSGMPAQWPTGPGRRTRPTPRSRVQVNFGSPTPPSSLSRRDNLKQQLQYESDGPMLADASTESSRRQPDNAATRLLEDYDQPRSAPSIPPNIPDAASMTSDSDQSQSVLSRRSSRKRAAATRTAVAPRPEPE